MKIKTSELIGPALDWAVQEIEYQRMVAEGEHVKQWALDDHRAGASINPYSTDWLWGGPIIEREAHNLFKHNGGTEWCCACNVPRDGYTAIVTADGPTPLIAVMRCYVSNRLGNEVEVPEELL